jgi:hypothetical protein
MAKAGKMAAKQTYTFDEYRRIFAPEYRLLREIEDDDEFEREVMKRAAQLINDRRRFGRTGRESIS